MSEPLHHMPGKIEAATLRERELNYVGTANASECADFAMRAAILSLNTLSYTLETRPWRKGVWVEGTLKATVEQECVATLAPVSTLIDESFARGYLPTEQLFGEERAGLEVEITDDYELGDAPEPLPNDLDLSAILFETLTLALPEYPRLEEADTITVTAEPEGAEPLNADNVKPFAELKALRDQLSAKDDKTS